MPRVASALVRLLVAVALAAGLGPICFDLLHWVGHSLNRLPPDTIATAAGILLGILFVLWRRPNMFWHTWIHEHTHLVAGLGLLVFWSPEALTATKGRGGEVLYQRTDPVRGTLIQIAPYALPLFLLPVLFVRHLLVTEPGTWRQILSGLTGFLYAAHLQALFHNIRLNWSGDDADLVKVGRPLAFVLIALSLMLVTAWTLRALWTGFPSGM